MVGLGFRGLGISGLGLKPPKAGSPIPLMYRRCLTKSYFGARCNSVYIPLIQGYWAVKE